MNKLLSIFFMLSFAGIIQAQDKFFTKTGRISFDATAPKSPENIEGINKSVTCVLDTKTGNVQFSVLMKGFEFDRAAMQEHFNENYVQSSKFPKSEFKGSITDNANVNYAKDGVYKVKVKGQLTIHGETKDVETAGEVTVKGSKINVNATFTILLEDYKIEIPGLVADKVSKKANIKVDCSLEPLKK